MKKILVILLSVFLSACSSFKISKKGIETADFGQKPSTSFIKSKIDAYYDKALFDPFSARIECNYEPKKVVGREYGNWLVVIYGYLAYCDINAKNRFGAYTGKKRNLFLFNNEGMKLMSQGSKFKETHSWIEEQKRNTLEN